MEIMKRTIRTTHQMINIQSKEICITNHYQAILKTTIINTHLKKVIKRIIRMKASCKSRTHMDHSVDLYKSKSQGIFDKLKTNIIKVLKKKSIKIKITNK